MDKTGKSKLLEECVSYFKARPVYEKLFSKMRDKYAGLGHFGGAVLLTSLGRDEKEQLNGFFQKDYTANKTITISANLMEKCLASSRFSELTWEQILAAYFGKSLDVKKEIVIEEAKRRDAYFAEIMEGISDKQGKEWLKNVLAEKKEGYLLVMQLYRESPEELRSILTYVADGIAAVEEFQGRKKKELLPVFAAKITGNPHYFDEGKPGEKLLFAYLKDCICTVVEEGLSRVEYKNRVYYEAGILKNEVSNDVLAYGIHGWKTRDQIHEGIEGFLQGQEPVKLTLQTLGKLEKVCGQDRQVYIVENPAVFSLLVSEHSDWTVICGNGQLRLAVLVLLDKFPEDSIFRYAGDFDPEGLLIAQRLKMRYKNRLELWNYHADLYGKYLSDVKLSDRRIKKLGQVHIEELQEIKKVMCKEKRAVYQESMIEELEESMESEIKNSKKSSKIIRNDMKGLDGI